MKDYELDQVEMIGFMPVKFSSNNNFEISKKKLDHYEDLFNNENNGKSQNYFKKVFLYIYEIFLFIPGILSIMIYLKSLEGCYDTQFDCIKKITPDLIKKMVHYLIFCGFLINAQFLLFTLKISSRKHIIVLTLIYIYLCFIYDTGAYFDSHGAYNRLILFLFVIGWAGILNIFRLIYYFFKKKTLITVITILIIIFYLNEFSNRLGSTSCIDWEKGFKGVEIDNSIGCKLSKPGICYFKILDGYLDLTRIIGATCDNMGTNKLTPNLQYMKDKSTKIIGYPRIESWPFFPDSSQNKIQKIVMDRLLNMENPLIETSHKDKIEVTTNFHLDPPKVTINLKKNEDVLIERRPKYELNKDKILATNVLYVFIDSLSRPNFKRKLPKLYKWLEDKYSTESNQSENKYESFQFLKFHALGTFTGINMMPAIYGLFNNENGGPHFVKSFQDAGFITGQALNYCGREVFDLDDGAIKYLPWVGWDHELSSFFCDGNFTPYDDIYAILVGLNSIRIRCLYNKSTTSYNLEYSKQFWEKYKNEPKLFRLGFYEAHEGSYEVIKYSDDELFDFFYDFEKQGHLENTIVIFHSDHGLGMAGPYSGLLLEDYTKELVLPSLFMILPTNIKNYSEIRENLKHNEQSFSTHFTLFNTFRAILIGKDNSSRNGYSSHEKWDFFRQKIPRERDCKEFNEMAYYDNNFYCSCDKNE